MRSSHQRQLGLSGSSFVLAASVGMGLVACGADAKSPTENSLGACTDERDNDGDGFADCADQDCKRLAVCADAGGPDSDGDTDVDSDTDTDTGSDSDVDSDTGSDTGTISDTSSSSDTNTDVGCGEDCWGADGCLTDGGHCIRFTCMANTEARDVCADCFGWTEITYDMWMKEGYCLDVAQKYDEVNGGSLSCGPNGASCCESLEDCGDLDNVWHARRDGVVYVVGPNMYDAEPNCRSIDAPAPGGDAYFRITTCERP